MKKLTVNGHKVNVGTVEEAQRYGGFPIGESLALVGRFDKMRLLKLSDHDESLVDPAIPQGWAFEPDGAMVHNPMEYMWSYEVSKVFGAPLSVTQLVNEVAARVMALLCVDAKENDD